MSLRSSLVARLSMCLALGLSGCGGSSGTEAKAIDCAWFASESNCWKTNLAPAQSCLPLDSETGTFSSDLKTCTYASGATVTFDAPLVIPPSGQALSFTVTRSGQTCLRVKESK
ncbi:MAG: hypothetical protein HY901_04025 [Deltaproteobacteria bacterium]|nr:hypothetical protein [Deltaproteobacteria bacterium]